MQWVLNLCKLQYTHLWFDRNLSCLPMVWNLTLYLLKVCLKFKLLTHDLKSHDIRVLLGYFLSYYILYFYAFCVFGGEKQKKVEQNYIFSFLTKLGYGTLTELILGGQNVKFQKIDK